MKRIDITTILGIIALLYWLTDVINNSAFFQAPSWSLWFSSVGIGLTAVGLLTKNAFLLNSLFCALFVGELFWNLGFFSHVLFQKSVLGLTDYLFEGAYTTKDFLITSYHVFLIPFLFIGIIKQKIIYTSAWIGATFYISIVSILTYFFAEHQATINCVHTIDNCKAFLSFLNHLATPLRIVISISLATLIMFIPTNYLLVKLGEKFRLSINSQR